MKKLLKSAYALTTATLILTVVTMTTSAAYLNLRWETSPGSALSAAHSKHYTKCTDLSTTRNNWQGQRVGKHATYRGNLMTHAGDTFRDCMRALDCRVGGQSAPMGKEPEGKLSRLCQACLSGKIDFVQHVGGKCYYYSTDGNSGLTGGPTRNLNKY